MSTSRGFQKVMSSLAIVFVTCGSLLLVVSLALAAPAKPTGTIIVNPGDSIQAVIDSATPGDTILINAGTYTESLTLSKAVSLTGVSSATVVIRSPGGGHVIVVSGSDVNQTVVISGLMVTGGNAYYGGGMYVTDNAQPLIQNVIFTGNSAGSDGMGGGGGMVSDSPLTLIGVNFVDNTADSGGGLYLIGNVTVILTNCHFINNFGGGIASEVDVIPAWNNRVFLFNTDFISNSTYTGYYPAGVSISGEAFVTGGRFENNIGGGLRANRATVVETQFISNSARIGGALMVGDASVTSSYFERNRASGEGGAIRAYRSLLLTDTTMISNTGVDYGGAVYVEQIVGVASVSGGRFINNRVTSGNLYGLGGGLFSFYDISVTATDFISNTALRGGGLYARGAAVVANSRFQHNRSTSTLFSGGGGMSTGGALVLMGTEFTSNSAVHDGGGLYYYGGGDTRIVNASFADNTTTSDGAALFLYSTGGHVDLLHVTIADDGLNPKQAIFAQNGSVRITNTIIANHAIGIERWSGATIYEDYNLFYGNTKNVSGTISSGSHQPVGNPQFVNPAAGDYHIQPSSVAFNAGADISIPNDIDGQPRPYGPHSDIGADEYWPTVVTDLHVSGSITDSTSLTTTLQWTAPIYAITYTMRYSTSAINESNWANAVDVTAPFTSSAAGSFESLSTVIPYSDGTAYFALKSQDASGAWSSLSNNAFWPTHNVFLPLVRK
jgi:hypothetical protein